MTAAAGPSREDRVVHAALESFADVTALDGARLVLAPEAPGSPMLNRIVGLGVGAAASEAQLDAALAALPRGLSFYVAVAPAAQPADLPLWLQARGLEPSWGWMRFHRDVAAIQAADTALRIAMVQGHADAAAFAHVVRESYGLPHAVEARVARAPDSGWLCWVAYHGDEPAGAAGMYAAEGVGYLGLAGTVAEHRGLGAQSALLAARVRHAAKLGCDLLVTETGERTGDRPSNSYRNILRAGFEESEVTAHWLGRS